MDKSAFHVSPAGKDAWSGKWAEPVRARHSEGPFGTLEEVLDTWSGIPEAQRYAPQDGPFATLAHALEVTRALPAGEERYIVVHGGVYYGVSLLLDARDNGLTLEAASGEQPVFYGGVPVDDWQPDPADRRFVCADVSALGAQAAEIRALQVNGRFCPRARLPGEGAFTHHSHFKVRWMSTTLGGWERKPTQEELSTLKFDSADLGPWLDARNAELTVYHAWDDSTVGIESIDFHTHTIRFTNPAGHPPGAFAEGTPHARTYVVWNVREGMLAPGQWYLDRTHQRIVYWPLAGETVKEAIVATQTCIIRLEGQEGAPVSGITLRGLTLAGTTTPLIAADFGAEKLDGALSGNGHIQDCLFEHLAIRNVAGHGIKLRGEENRNLRVQACEIDTTGAGGIYLSGEDCAITHNTIAHTGLMYPAAIGIFFAGKRDEVSHNDIHDTSYSGIDSGGGVGHRIEHNHFARVMCVLNDGAAIYAFANQGTIIRGNVAVDIGGGPGARHAYYLDERSENCLVADNLAVDVPWCLHNHMAHHNTIRDNVCIVHGDMKISFHRSHDYSLERNIFYATGSIRFIGVEGITHYGQNIFYSAENLVEGVHLIDYVETDDLVIFTSDARICLADPCFVDVERGDLRLRPDSPAHALGIATLEISEGRKTKDG